ncbi:MAG: hypothetical protein PWQ86_83 [Bacillota bacterium]|jgi:HJR/Mrr/RecB family endonuclease|nr:hypothetical protein [Bacillota bacterium]
MELSNRVWRVNDDGFVCPFDAQSAPTNVRQQILTQLLEEERAVAGNSEILIPHKVVAELPEEERSLLELPDSYPFTVEIRASGNLTAKDLKYVYYFRDGSGRPFFFAKRIGSCLRIDEEQIYLLTGQLYWLIEAIDSFNARNPEALGRSEAIKENLLEFAKIKGLAEATGAVLDLFLNKEQVLVPSGLTVRLHRCEDGAIEIEPVLTRITEDDGTRATELLNDEQQAEFLKRFDKFNVVRDLYDIPNGPKIVLDDKIKEALKEFKRFRRVSGQAKEAILYSPQIVFDPETVNLDDFSDRVIEIGEHPCRSFPFPQALREAWLPAEEGEDVENPELSGKDSGPELTQDESTPYAEGAGNIIYGEGTEDRSGTEQVCAETRPHYVADKSCVAGQYSLVIKDNFYDVEFETALEQRSSKMRLPRSLRPEVQLLPHQKEGLQWLQRMYLEGRRGALLADDMGLGKTLQALAFLAWVQECNEAEGKPNKPMLIVAPVALLENWKREYERFLDPVFGPLVDLYGSGLNGFKATHMPIVPDDELREIIKGAVEKGKWLEASKLQRCGAVLTTYETLRDYQVALGRVNWAVMVLDECQKIKNPTALVTGAAKGMKYDFGLCLTGTPVENSLVDLWSIMDFACPGHLGSLKNFVSKYHTPLAKPETNREKLGMELRQHVGSLMLRRLKDNYLHGLPEKQVHLCPAEMPPEQLNRYKDIIRRARQTLPDRYYGNRKEHIFKIIQELRKVSLHPYLDYDERALEQIPDEAIIRASARLAKAVEILDQVRDKKEKAIVYLIDRKLQRVLQRLLYNRYAIRAAIINGTVSACRRQFMVDDFQNKEGFNVIIMSPEAAGVGLNITAANHVIHLSREWNPAKEDQATDRVYRIGQERTVHVYIPLAVHASFGTGAGEGTFDQKLHRLLESKRQLSRAVLMPAFIEESEMQQLGEELLTLDLTEEETEASVLSIEDIDRMQPEAFEKVVAALYRKMSYEIFLTPSRGDMGADVIALSESKPSCLIQCKHHLDPSKAQGMSAVQEVSSAAGIYERQYDKHFKTVVITNAVRFTDSAVELARSNGVDLIARKGLAKMLEETQISWADLEI